MLWHPFLIEFQKVVTPVIVPSFKDKKSHQLKWMIPKDKKSRKHYDRNRTCLLHLPTNLRRPLRGCKMTNSANVSTMEACLVFLGFGLSTLLIFMESKGVSRRKECLERHNKMLVRPRLFVTNIFAFVLFHFLSFYRILERYSVFQGFIVEYILYTRG